MNKRGQILPLAIEMNMEIGIDNRYAANSAPDVNCRDHRPESGTWDADIVTGSGSEQVNQKCRYSRSCCRGREQEKSGSPPDGSGVINTIGTMTEDILTLLPSKRSGFSRTFLCGATVQLFGSLRVLMYLDESISDQHSTDAVDTDNADQSFNAQVMAGQFQWYAAGKRRVFLILSISLPQRVLTSTDEFSAKILLKVNQDAIFRPGSADNENERSGGVHRQRHR